MPRTLVCQGLDRLGLEIVEDLLVPRVAPASSKRVCLKILSFGGGEPSEGRPLLCDFSACKVEFQAGSTQSTRHASRSIHRI